MSSSSFHLARAFPSLFNANISATIPIYYPYTLTLCTGSVRIHVGTLTDFFSGLGKETVDYIGRQRQRGSRRTGVCRVCFHLEFRWSRYFQKSQVQRIGFGKKRLKDLSSKSERFLFSVTFYYKIDLIEFFSSRDKPFTLYIAPGFRVTLRKKVSTIFERMHFELEDTCAASLIHDYAYVYI